MPINIIIVALCVALLPLSTPIYTAIRIVITVASIAHIIRQKDKGDVKLLPYYALAILYNPLVPIWLDRSVWVVIDLLAVVTIGYLKYNGKAMKQKNADSLHKSEPLAVKVKKASAEAESAIDNHVSKTQPYLIVLVVILIIITIALKG
jgi:hypothetical protein